MAGVRDYFPILKDRVRSRQFNSLFLFVTSRCNSLCRTCFYFDKLNSPDDLTDEQMARISASAPPFRKLWISGGEPFLRERLADIVAAFVRQNGVRNVNLPTNGLLPEKIFPTMDRMLELCPETAIDLNFSLDGLQKTHDSIRGVPDNFVRTLGTIARGGQALSRNPPAAAQRADRDHARKLRRDRGVGRVPGEARRDRRAVFRGGARAGARSIAEGSDPRAGGGAAQEPDAVSPALRGEAVRAPGAGGSRTWLPLYYLGNLGFHFRLHEQCLESPEAWPMPCTAGETSIVIDHNGRFRACEMRGIVGDLHDYDFDVRRALESEAMRQETGAIPGANCWCTHSCFIQESSKFSAKVQLLEIPWAGLSAIRG